MPSFAANGPTKLTLAAHVVSLGHAAPHSSAYLRAAAGLLMQALPVDALLAIRQPQPGAWVAEHAQGVRRATLQRLSANWECYRRELAPVFDRAARSGAAVDAHEMGERWVDTRYFLEIVAPQRAVATAIVLLRFQGAALGAFVLGRRRDFAVHEIELMRELSPCLALGLAAHAAASAHDQAGTLAVLTPSEREVTSYVCLGYTNKEIAVACGISPNRVRNKLVRIFERLGVSTRAELSGLAARGYPAPRRN
jgi:DNA-binding CsgD family transcriptional regulator